MNFDRCVSPELLEHLGPEGSFRWMADKARTNALIDLELRRPSATTSRASLYVGLTAVLHLDERAGTLRADAHATHRKAGSFQDAWREWQPADSLAAQAQGLKGYVDSLLEDDRISKRFTDREGIVSASLASGAADGFALIQREAQISFPSEADRANRLARLTKPLVDAISASDNQEPWWPAIANGGKLPNLGTKLDVLAVDRAGRLLIIEAKPADALAGIAWAPVQVATYAGLFAALLDENPDAVSILQGMLRQRVELGLSPDGFTVPPAPEIQPVIGIGPPLLSGQPLERLAAVANTLPTAPGVEPLEVWLLDGNGVPTVRWRPTEDPTVPDLAQAPTAPPSTFVGAARQGAIAWKQTSSTLPDDARSPGLYRGAGPYEFCLPADHAELNLLPEARERAISRFAACGIPWHHGIGGGPSNHLLSSQVQCANALAPFVDDADSLRTIFGDVLDIAEVLEFEAGTTSHYDTTDFVVFEWIGQDDPLGEWGTKGGTRGANNTSADAAIRYRTSTGEVEVALIEWKYTEQYQGHELSGGPASKRTRMARYADFWHDPDSPVRTDLIPYEDLFVEPFYQLFRLQLLAWRMELAGQLGAKRVRLVDAAPSANEALWRSLNRPSHSLRNAGFGVPGFISDEPTVLDVWRAMQRRPDRFVYFDTANLVAPGSPTSAEFKARYGHLAENTRRFSSTDDAVARFQAAAEQAAMVLLRVIGEGSVLQSVIADERMAALPPNLLDETASRLEELTELSRRLRADDLSRLFHLLGPEGAPRADRGAPQCTIPATG